MHEPPGIPGSEPMPATSAGSGAETWGRSDDGAEGAVGDCTVPPDVSVTEPSCDLPEPTVSGTTAIAPSTTPSASWAVARTSTGALPSSTARTSKPTLSVPAPGERMATRGTTSPTPLGAATAGALLPGPEATSSVVGTLISTSTGPRSTWLSTSTVSVAVSPTEGARSSVAVTLQTRCELGLRTLRYQ